MSVFSVPNKDLVVKVAELDPWPDYILWAAQNGHMGKFAPKVYSLKFHSGFYVAVMERLVCTVRQMKYADSGEYLDIHPDQVQIYNNLQYPEDCEAKDLAAYVRQLRDIRLSGDLHDGNVMVRSDGQLVITDPCSGNNSSKRFRIKNAAFA
jgi:hypothetical protein